MCNEVGGIKMLIRKTYYDDRISDELLQKRLVESKLFAAKIMLMQINAESGLTDCSENPIIALKTDYSTRDEHGRFTGSVPHGGSSGGGSSGGSGSSGESSGGTLSDGGQGNIAITDDAISKVPAADVFGDKDKNARYQQANKDLLTEAKKYPAGTEVSRIYDENMNPIVIRDKNGNVVKEYGYTVGEIGSVKIDDYEKPYHAFHNHPSGETFSPDDCIKMTEKDNMMSLTAVGNNSRLFVMSKSDSADAFGYSDFLSKKMSEQRFFNNTFSYLDIKEFNIEELPEKIRKPLQKEILSFCKECVAGGKKYGFNYIES